jgi:4-amino-4-deoxy-L-arabinose transferase-like glycosyltransferase
MGPALGAPTTTRVFRRTPGIAAALLLTVIAAARIVATYPVFSQTIDEPAQVAAGMEWLDGGAITCDVVHPPLGRVAVALGPFLSGARFSDARDDCEQGNGILYRDGNYVRNLAMARLGVLPFFILATLVVYCWTRSLFGDTAGVVAVLIFTMVPPILGHAAVATTDVPVAATSVAALFTFTRWLEQPNTRRSLVFGLTVGLAVLSKFSALVFLPAAGFALLACRWWILRRTEGAGRGSPRGKAAGVAAVAACLVIWTGYRFSFAPLASVPSPPYSTLETYTGRSGTLHDLSRFVVDSLPILAPALVRGVLKAEMRNIVGSRAYLLGEVREGGWWYFFWVVLAVKTPLALLILTGIGTVFLARQTKTHPDWRPVAPAVASLAILLVTTPARINYGVRHMLVVYPLLAIVAGFGAVALWNAATHRLAARGSITLLLGWLVVSSARAHPDYLAYFNEMAGSHPENVLVDSDLDWGQDLFRLAAALRAYKVDRLALAYYGSADLSRHGLPSFTRLGPRQPMTGWIAISLSSLKTAEPAGAFAWLEAYKPMALVGRSIRLYNVPRGAKP